jgi:hypothetical protein
MVLLAVLAGPTLSGLQSVNGAVRAAPVAANLPPTNVSNTGAFNVTVSNPVFANGRVNLLALRADVQPRTTGKKVNRVVFTVFRNGNQVFEQQEKGLPYCVFGDQNGSCTPLQVGDDFPNGQLVRVGNYTVQIAVFSTATQPEWKGTVQFGWDAGAISAEKPPYGTGQGNGPYAEIFDAYYASAGMNKIKIEVRAQNKKGRPNGTGIRQVTFRVSRYGDDYATVYVGNELSKPYCIFGEASDGRTCKTLRVGDEWPESTRVVENDNGEVTGKEPDPDITPGTIEPGEYNISIRIDADNGNWSSNGDVTLVP